LADRYELWIKSLKSETAKVYGRYTRRLFTAVNLTPDEVLDKIKQEKKDDDYDTYTRLINETANLTERGRYIATYALRAFLKKNGLWGLPPAELGEPERVKEGTRLEWDQALAICAAASKPYNLVFKMMLHCGWGAGEFLKFNTAKNWEHIKTELGNGNGPEYVRIDYSKGRKKNRKPFYTLVPSGLLKEVLACGIQVPIAASHGYAIDQNHKRLNKVGGIQLDEAHRGSARLYLEKAFATALKRAPITVTGKPTPHELRDTFRTQASWMKCEGHVAEFLMGHEIDKNDYDKCCLGKKGEAYVWQELKKIYGPQPAQIDKVAEENKQLNMKVATQSLEVENLRAAFLELADEKNENEALADSAIKALGDKVSSQGLEIRNLQGLVKQLIAERRKG
jgi:integrase